ncbi:hypothetical protein FDECE_16988 [Fusarium decemcellulare]|nr:hypothetical protein FDECE_16988 [Fusarium decemcellulare]
MTSSKLLLSCVLTAVCSIASALHEQSASSPGFVSMQAKRTYSPEISKRDVDTEVTLYNYTNWAYSVELSIGSPAQQIRLQIDSGSSETWVNPNCANAGSAANQQLCKSWGQYDFSKSKTGTNLHWQNTLAYGSGGTKVAYIADNVSIPDSTINLKNVSIGVASDTSGLFAGILGLGYGIDRNSDFQHFPNFIDRLADQNVTATKAMSVALGSAADDNAGVIIFGGVDTKKFSGNLTALPILSQMDGDYYRYLVKLDSMGLTMSGSNKTYDNSTLRVLVDSGHTDCQLPASILTDLANDLGGDWDPISKSYVADCSVLNTNGTVDFTLSGRKISVPFAEFITPQEDKNGKEVCRLGSGNINFGNYWVLGDSFMRAAYTIFDQTSDKVFIAPYEDCGTHQQAITTDGPADFVGECGQATADDSKPTTTSSGSGSGPTTSQTTAPQNENTGSRAAVSLWVGLGALAAGVSLL